MSDFYNNLCSLAQSKVISYDELSEVIFQLNDIPPVPKPKKEPKMRKSDSFELVKGDPLHRRYTGFLLIDWNTGGIRVVKTQAPVDKKSPFEVPVAFEISVKMPQVPVKKMKLDMVLSDIQCSDIVVESL